MTPKTRWLLSALGVGLLLDQATKAWARGLDPRGEQVEIIPGWLAFVHAKNPGAAFSMLADSPYRLHFFAVFTVVTVTALIFAWRSTEPDDRWTGLAIGLFLVGALGNAIDRSWQGYVTDFVKCYAGSGAAKEWAIAKFGTNVYPIWNVADAAIVCAVPIYLFTTVFRKDKPAAADDGDEPGGPLTDPLGSNAP